MSKDWGWVERNRREWLYPMRLTETVLVVWPYYLPYMGFRGYGDCCDALGNCLAILTGVASPAQAAEQLERLAELNRQGVRGEWEFNEWAHGVSGRPMGFARQSWSAGKAPAERTLFAGDDLLVVSALKPSDNRAGVVLHAHNPTSIERQAAVEGERVRLDETPTSGDGALRPFEIAAWRLE